MANWKYSKHSFHWGFSLTRITYFHRNDLAIPHSLYHSLTSHAPTNTRAHFNIFFWFGLWPFIVNSFPFLSLNLLFHLHASHTRTRFLTRTRTHSRLICRWISNLCKCAWIIFWARPRSTSTSTSSSSSSSSTSWGSIITTSNLTFNRRKYWHSEKEEKILLKLSSWLKKNL